MDGFQSHAFVEHFVFCNGIEIYSAKFDVEIIKVKVLLSYIIN